ncbi:efflux RND transporter permease subunit [Desulfosporosinus nitroreducens]|uniref:efflux RND transporter permease subunit n=1 Tax=Desulfosporosinus nitroreducens TaxID=2018668 RepID=UPI0035A2E43A
MKKGLIYQVIHNRRFTLFFTFIAILLGLYSYYVIPKQESPNVNAPFAIIIGLLAFGQPLSFTAMVGVVSLMGVVIKNAILLIEFINSARQEGMTVTDACFDAVGKRYRPIFLSAMTTVIGLVPLALSGSDLFEPLSVAIMCGLTVSTLLTLVIIPVIYSLWFSDGTLTTEKNNLTV